MKILSFFTLNLFLFLSFAAETPVPTSPAQKRIDQARDEIKKTPARYQTHNTLAAALLRRARETGDPGFLNQAQGEVEQSLHLQQDNYEGRKIEAGILLARHESARAKQAALALNKRNMDDIEVYGLLADAAGELGDYKAAENAAQWMLDLRPADYRSLEHGAEFREVFGNQSGAADLWVAAFRQSPDAETEERAWILVNLANLNLKMGNVAAAEKAASDALKTFPAYHLAVIALAHVRVAQEKFSEAADLLSGLQRITVAEQYTMAQALEKANRPEAPEAWSRFDSRAHAEMEKPGNANRELAFYLEQQGRLAEALKVARFEAGNRQDILTCDALSWALHLNGDDAGARKEMDKVLAVGTRDPDILAHAKVLASVPERSREVQ